MRLQEYADGSRWYRKVFELDTFVADWCARHGEAHFSYPERWNGYNVAGSILDLWLEAVQRASTLRAEEEELLAALRGAAGPPPWKGSYLFGVCDEEGPAEKALVTLHECAHAYYHLAPRYRQQANSILSELPREYRLRAEAALRGKGYHPKAFPDELQAYLATGDCQHGVLGLKTLGSKLKHFPWSARLAALFRQTQQSFASGPPPL